MKKFYPQLPADTHPAVQDAINQLYDHVYSLRGENETLKGRLNATSAPSAKKFTGDIQGIQIKATTDPSSLKNNYTLRYNSATGQFEFGP